MGITKTINAKSQLRNFYDDIEYAINEEDSEINVSNNDLVRINLIKETIESLENDYECLHDKIIIAAQNRLNEIGQESARTDIVFQTLLNIIKSEQKLNE